MRVAPSPAEAQDAARAATALVRDAHGEDFYCVVVLIAKEPNEEGRAFASSGTLDPEAMARILGGIVDEMREAQSAHTSCN